MKGPGGTSPGLPSVWMAREVPPGKSGLLLRNGSTSTLLLAQTIRPQTLERAQVILAWRGSCILQPHITVAAMVSAQTSVRCLELYIKEIVYHVV